jgi:hypothetical protein
VTIGQVGLNLETRRPVLPVDVSTTMALAFVRYEASTAAMATAWVVSS